MRTSLTFITSFHGNKNARLRRDGLDEWISLRMAAKDKWQEYLTSRDYAAGITRMVII